MPIQPTYPGVFVEELPSGNRTITGVSTSVATFVGMTDRGPMDTSVRVSSFADYERSFGNDTSTSEMTDQVRQFFLNGGQTAYVMRIANGAVKAEVTLDNEFGSPTLKLTAREAGATAHSVRVEVDYDTASPESTFNLTASREVVDGQGIAQFTEVEVHRDLSMNPSSARYVTETLALESSLVDAELDATPPSSFNGYSTAGLLLAGAADFSRMDALLAANGNVGRFQVSVDESAWVEVVLNGATTSLAAINTALGLALAPTGKTATAVVDEIVFAGPALLSIEASGSGSGQSVRVRSASQTDIAAGMQWGLGNGGLEVGGYADLRPAPTAFVSKLGSFSMGRAQLTPLRGFLDALKSANDTPDIDPGDSLSITYPGDAGAKLSQTLTTDDESLRHARANMDAFVSTANAMPSPVATASRAGLRIRLDSVIDGADAGLELAVPSGTAPAYDSDAGDLGILHDTSNVNQYRLGSYPDFGYSQGTAAGTDGLAPKALEYDAAYPILERDVETFNIMVLPRSLKNTPPNEADRNAIFASASVCAERNKAFLLVDPPASWTDADTAAAGIDALRIGMVKDHSAVYWPRVQIRDSSSGAVRKIDPSGSIAGLMARIDGNRGVWKAPAGLEADLRGVRGVEIAMNDADNGQLNPQAVNAIRVFPNGVISWGARTMDGFDNSGNADFKYIPIRRLTSFMEESLSRGLQFAVFEPNDEPLWSQIRLAAGAFMNNLFRQGAFAGTKSSDAYFVKCDRETTTQNDIDLGIVNVLVGFAPLKPAEFVILKIQQKAGQVQV